MGSTRGLVGILGAVVAGALLVQGAQRPAGTRCALGYDSGGASVIVQGRDVSAAARLVRGAGGEITHELGIINAVAARLSPAQTEALAARRGSWRLYADRAVRTVGKPRGEGGPNADADGLASEVAHTKLVAADKLHAEGIDGHGVTVAVIDTGLYNQIDITDTPSHKLRLVAQYDAILGEPVAQRTNDDSGHGAHVTSVVLNASFDGKRRSPSYYGIAPYADLVSVKAFGKDGSGTYADVIRGLDWVVANRSRYGIRVLNLSFSARPLSYYWDDPLNQAVMAAWQAGIVVVASAGNGGPEAMTIGVPGNVPYVITVGAMSDNWSPEVTDDDHLTTFSASGPTVEGFVKPELIAPGGHIVGIMSTQSQIVLEHPEFHDGGNYFMMSGTSAAAAVVSGVAALLLQADPALSPDDVKCRLMASAHPAVDPDTGLLAYNPLQQGAGLVNAHDAGYSTAAGCANRGLDVDSDLAGREHFVGPVRRDEEGNFYILDAGYSWDGFYADWRGMPWVDWRGMPWVDGVPWTDGMSWIDWQGVPWVDWRGMPWVDGVPWVDGAVFSSGLSETMAINTWVDQE